MKRISIVLISFFLLTGFTWDLPWEKKTPWRNSFEANRMENNKNFQVWNNAYEWEPTYYKTTWINKPQWVNKQQPGLVSTNKGMGIINHQKEWAVKPRENWIVKRTIQSPYTVDSLPYLKFQNNSKNWSLYTNKKGKFVSATPSRKFSNEAIRLIKTHPVLVLIEKGIAKIVSEKSGQNGDDVFQTTMTQYLDNRFQKVSWEARRVGHYWVVKSVLSGKLKRSMGKEPHWLIKQNDVTPLNESANLLWNESL